MAIRVTRWGPDTCGCVFDYQWDDTLAGDVRTHTLTRVVNTCPEHPSLTSVSLFDAVANENRTKNTVLSIAQGVISAIAIADYTFSYDASRVLQARFAVTLNQNQKKNIQDACDLQFGPGVVLIL